MRKQHQVMSAAHALLVSLLGWSLAVVLGVMVGVRLAWAWLRGAIKNHQARPVPPACLYQPHLGRHKFVKIQVSLWRT